MDIFKFILAFLVGLGAFFALTLLGVYHLEKFACHEKWAQSGLVSKYDLWTDCQISTDGGKTFIPEGNYREIAE